MQNHRVHIPAKVDYGIRALLSLAVAGAPQTAEELASDQGLPPRFLGAILADLRGQAALTGPRALGSLFFGGGTPPPPTSSWPT